MFDQIMGRDWDMDAQQEEENNGWASYVPSGYILHDSTD